jgi:hypothetical protein
VITRARLAGFVPALLIALAARVAGAADAHSACDYLTRTIQAQPGSAVFLASYPTVEHGPLQQAAFVYDNAVAAIALVACGQAAQARRIGDAMLLALEHDRYWHDGRLRNAYAAGAVSAAPLKLPGWWDTTAARWLEDGYEVSSDSGNMAWAMLALLTLDARADDRYRRGARQIAQWLAALRDERGAGGFTGGYFGHEPEPHHLRWKSTEHNVDLAAAFARLATTSADAQWAAQAAAATSFVDSMWSAERGAFAVGTGTDGQTINPMLALDAQIWPLLALPQASERYAAALTLGASGLRSGQGYSYSEAGGGVWTEGSAQMVVLLKRLRRTAEARSTAAAVAAARASDGGYYATDVAAVPTGFMLATDPGKPRMYLHLEHLGASAWAALAEQGFNPFTGARTLPH